MQKKKKRLANVTHYENASNYFRFFSNLIESDTNEHKCLMLNVRWDQFIESFESWRREFCQLLKEIRWHFVVCIF